MIWRVEPRYDSGDCISDWLIACYRSFPRDRKQTTGACFYWFLVAPTAPSLPASFGPNGSGKGNPAFLDISLIVLITDLVASVFLIRLAPRYLSPQREA